MPKTMKLLACAVLTAGLLHYPAQAGKALEAPKADSALYWQAAAAQGEEAQSFIQSMGDEVIGYIVDTNLTQEQRAEMLDNVLRRNFDLYTISRFTLGRYWHQLTPAEQQEYRRLVEDLVVAIYSRKFSDYNGQKFEVTGVRPAGDKDFIVSSMILQPNAKDIPVGWHIRRKNGGFQIVDVTVEDVSMIVTQKSDFASVIQRQGGNPAVILDHLRERLDREAS